MGTDLLQKILAMLTFAIFFVKDMIDKKLVRVLYCPTGKMLADFFTKPLQGSLFRFFRDIIMGYTSITEILDEHPKIKERVENLKNYKSEILNKVEDHIKRNNIRTKEYVHPSDTEKVSS